MSNNKIKHGNQGKRVSLLEQFLSLVNISQDPDACWIWIGAKNKGEYGKLGRKIDGKRKFFCASKVSYLLFRGQIPQGIFVCHNCPGRDNPSCVNPKHLWLGSHSDNMKDAYKKGTIVNRLPPVPRGSENYAAKLNEDQVIEIRKMYQSGRFTQYQLADQYGVCQRTICLITRREKWTHI